MKITYQSKANRDDAALTAKKQGRRVRKTSSRGVVLSPDYVADYEGTATPNGFGGSAPEFFAVVYHMSLD